MRLAAMLFAFSLCDSVWGAPFQNGSFELGSIAWRLERELHFGLEMGEGRTQLMTRIGHEAPLAFQRGLETGKHLVERFAEPRDPARGNAAPYQGHARDRTQRFGTRTIPLQTARPPSRPRRQA